MYLDTLQPTRADVGFGQFGRCGSLGYEEKAVLVQQQFYPHALSTHAPAHLVFQLEGCFTTFRCQVAFNDDVPAGSTSADFLVLSDGQEIASVLHMVAGEPPRAIEANVSHAQQLELIVRTEQFENCHTVWLNAELDESMPVTMLDCLHRVRVTLLVPLPKAERCIATVVSPGYEKLLDDMLGSLYANGGCQDALLVVLVLNANDECERVIAKYRALPVYCQPNGPLGVATKSVLYSIAHFINARQFLCLDADMLVLGNLSPIFAALDACPPNTVLACREGNYEGQSTLGQALENPYIYGGTLDNLTFILGKRGDEEHYPLVVNDGLFAGSREALLALDRCIRAMPGALSWANHPITWRNQFIFNLALAHLHCGIELAATYNLQVHVQDVQMYHANGRIRAAWHGLPVRVIHFNGIGRQKYPAWRGLFAEIPDPLVGTDNDCGDSYATFLAVLRAWIGRHGLAALTWSFYGTTDGHSARVRDASTFPLLALLHYLIRSNGCIRVLETGTARGISAACLASAVSHRPGGQVVTLDPHSYPERADLWAALPDAMRTCIEPRAIDSLAGMEQALAAGERYEAALLDTIHSAEHVWNEFQLASKLVCPGGLILIHDSRYIYGTVEAALQRIESAGYNVVRLWSAESGIQEDDHLGLAIVENRC